ncbi:unnamed protein product [Effrenium voratum]|nr:unnamed protein product [Effrenium voratum]
MPAPGTADGVDKAATHFQSLKKRCAVPSETNGFFEPLVASNSHAKRRWAFRARELQPLFATDLWKPSDIQRLQRAMHAELLESTFQENFEQSSAGLDHQGQQQLFVKVAGEMQGKRLRDLLPERIEFVDWLRVSQKMKALTLGVEGDLPCMSPSNCLIQYIHLVMHKSHDPVTKEEEEMMHAARHLGPLHANQIADRQGLPLPGVWRLFCHHMRKLVEEQQPCWQTPDLLRLHQAYCECGDDWELVAARVGDFSPEECERQWRKSEFEAPKDVPEGSTHVCSFAEKELASDAACGAMR